MSPLLPIEEKIRNLLAKAASTDSVHEAEALSAAAEKLMIKHSIDQAMLDSTKKDDREKVVLTKMEFEGIYGEVMTSYFAQIATALGGARCYIEQYDAWNKNYRRITKKILVIVAHESDAARAEQLIRSLEQQALHTVKIFWKNHPYRNMGLSGMEAYKERRQFIMSFIVAASVRIHQNLKAEVASVTGAELVLVQRMDEVIDAMPSDLRKTKSHRQGGSAIAQSAGWTAGTTAGDRIDQKSI